jgi:flagellar biosynthesis/type III secretory pathway protein FliH
MDASGQRSAVNDAPAEDASSLAALEETSTLAAGLLRDAEGEAVAIRQRAYIEGRAEGEADGRAAARADLLIELQTLQAVGLEVAAVRESILRGSEAELVELTAEAARAVVGEAVARDPALVTTSVRRALDRAAGRNVLRVRVNPADASIVSAYLDHTPATANGTWDVSPDGAITVGGCVIDIDGGEIDARLDVQLDVVINALRELVPFALPRLEDEEQLRAA